MDNGKTMIDPHSGDKETTGEIANWLDTISKSEAGRGAAFRRTLDGLLGG
ncbi:hypothetical protein [Croceicoccus naphthovorans]|nr:hypothetical protein [Croceicoccus naphthovorans]MBB3990726.1 hypothetical protein [Croceicoccus naphthovorans]